VLENNDLYYRVRVQAAHVLADLWTKMASSSANVGPLPLICLYKKCFMLPAASTSTANIVKPNDFADLQTYLLQTSLPLAMAGVRSAQGTCPSEVVRFLLDILKYNENSRNKFSDACLRASLVDALSATLTASSVTATSASSTLVGDTRLVVEQFVLKLNMEKIVPSCRYAITCSCLRALRNLQRLGHTPPAGSALFRSYASYEHNCEEVRVVAFEILAEILSRKSIQELISK
jgi:transcription initiation factor TFIID subunit 2